MLGIEVPPFVERRAAFSVALEPQIAYPDYMLEWNDPERFPCQCCGFPTIFVPGRYEMCSLCDWEDEDYPEDVNYGGGPNGPYNLFAARVNFEAHGCMSAPEKSPDDFARCHKPEIVAAKQKFMRACLDFLQIEKDSPARCEEWEIVLRLEVALINTTQGDQLDYEELSRKLRKRAYPVAVSYNPDLHLYSVHAPDFPECSTCSGTTIHYACEDHAGAISRRMLDLRLAGQPFPEPSNIEMLKGRSEYEGCSWEIIERDSRGHVFMPDNIPTSYIGCEGSGHELCMGGVVSR